MPQQKEYSFIDPIFDDESGGLIGEIVKYYSEEQILKECWEYWSNIPREYWSSEMRKHNKPESEITPKNCIEEWVMKLNNWRIKCTIFLKDFLQRFYQ
jgi:hypothetical protein